LRDRRTYAGARPIAQHAAEAALAHLDIGKQTAANTTVELAGLDQRKRITVRALDLLQEGKARAYDKALGDGGKN
jgi:hypothetical protein